MMFTLIDPMAVAVVKVKAYDSKGVAIRPQQRPLKIKSQTGKEVFHHHNEDWCVPCP